MVVALVAIFLLGTLYLVVSAYMEWVGWMSLFGPHGTLREIFDGAHGPHPH